MAKRGAMAAPFISAWQRPRSAEERELRAYARKQLDLMDRIWREEDRDAGRRPLMVVAGKMVERWSAIDHADKPQKARRASNHTDLPAGSGERMLTGSI
jgi:hypothetical protein